MDDMTDATRSTLLRHTETSQPATHRRTYGIPSRKASGVFRASRLDTQRRRHLHNQVRLNDAPFFSLLTNFRERRNCAFQVHAHKALLSPETDKVAVPPSTLQAPGMDVLPYILLPLAGPEEFDLEVPHSRFLFIFSEPDFDHIGSRTPPRGSSVPPLNKDPRTRPTPAS